MNPVNNGFKRSRKKILMSVFPILLVIVFIGIGFYIFRVATQGTSQRTGTNTVAIASAKKTQNIDRTFSFPLQNTENEEEKSFKYIVESAELRDEIVVQGKKATAVNGRTFLIVNILLTNDLEQGLRINSRDYIRLSLNGNKEELLAPDIHNDPVEAQATSIKPTRVGFAIDNNATNLMLIVGEIGGKKQEIPLNF